MAKKGASLISMILGSPSSAELTPAQQAAAALGDQQRAKAQVGQQETIALPTDTLGDLVPQAQPLQPSPESVARVEGLAEENLLFSQDPVTGQQRMARPEDATRDLTQQLESERTVRPIDFEQGILTFPTTGDDNFVTKATQDIAQAEYAFTEEGFIGGANPEKTPHMSALAKLDLAEQKGGKGVKVYPKRGVGAAAYLAFMAALDTLATDRETSALEKFASTQVDRGVNYDEASQNVDEQNRHKFVGRVGELFEHLTRGPSTVDPVTGEASKVGGGSRLDPVEKLALGTWITGVMDQAGFMTHFDTKEKVKETQTPTMYLQETTVYTGGVKSELQYGLTVQGKKMLDEMAPMIQAVFPESGRKVSLTPLPLGRYIGEAAVGQKKRTKTPTQPELSSTMLSAMDVMGTMPNMISSHKLQMTEMMLSDVRTKYNQAMEAAKQQINYKERMAQFPAWENTTQDQKEAILDLGKELAAAEDAIYPQMESPFAVLFGMDAKKLKKIEEASFKSTVKKAEVFWDEEQQSWMKVGTKKEDVPLPIYGTAAATLDQNYPSRPTEPFMATVSKDMRGTGMDKKSHRKFAKEVALGELGKAEMTLKQAQDHKDHVFYFGVTAIGNSGRLMISQTELNYQASKLARFLIDNPRATQLTKGGHRDKSFRYLVARALIHGADTMQVKVLEQKFADAVADPNSELNELARMVYETTNKAGAKPEARMQLLGEVIQGANQGKYGFLDKGEWKHKGEWGFPLDALHEWGKYLATPEGAQMSTRMKVEVDGINNGSSIQGMQFGVNKILTSAGVVYEQSDDEVIPQGSLRDLLWKDIMTETPNGEWSRFGMSNVKKDVAARLGNDMMDRILKAIEKVDKKGFVKIPLMTTIYGMPSTGHTDHIRNYVFENATNPEFIEAGLTDDNLTDVIEFLDSVIATGLDFTLKEALLHQNLIKQTAGWFWNMWDIVPQIEGANGYMVPFGGDVMVPDQRLFVNLFDANRKSVSAPISISKPVVTAGAPKVDRGVSQVGKLARNHLAVNGTHNIDSTVAQETLIKAKEKLGPTFWGQQVFDAFIGDLSSIETLLEVSNQVFYDINKRYNMVEEEYKAFRRDRKKFNQRVVEAEKNGEVWTIEDEVGTEFQSMHAFIKKSLGPKGSALFQDYDKWLKVLQGAGVDVTSKKLGKTTMSPQQYLSIIREAYKNFIGYEGGVPVDKAFGNAIRVINASREEAFRIIMEDMVRQFN